MAFQRNAAVQNVSPFQAAAAVQQRSNNTSWQADAFLNLWLPTKDGGRRKVGYIPLKGNRSFDAAIIERLASGGQEALDAFAEVVEIEFHTAEPKEGSAPAF